jgi:Pectobacterium phage endonuclease
MQRKTTPAKIRFWRLIRIKGPDDCWPWKSRGKGYPNFWDGIDQIGANRFGLQLKLGRPLNPWELACHTCDNPRCLNPIHLFAGSSADNSRDMVLKKRKEVGENVAGAKLTDEKVLDIRWRYAKRDITLWNLATVYNVVVASIHHIVRGKTWKHVGGPIDTRLRCRREKGLKCPSKKYRKITSQ